MARVTLGWYPLLTMEEHISENSVQPKRRGRKTRAAANPMDRTIDRKTAETAAGGPTALDAMVDAGLVNPASLTGQTWYDRCEIEAALPILAEAKTCLQPAARILTTRATTVCRLAGCRLDDLVGDRKGRTPADVNARSMRVIALGLVVRLGRDLGLQWRLMCAPGKRSKGDEVPLLRSVHYASIQRAFKRAAAFAESGGAAGAAIEAGYREIQAKALADLGEAAQKAKHKSGKKSSSPA